MKNAGYAYVGPDEGICFSRGADGLLTPNLQRYPSGLRGLGERVEAAGGALSAAPQAGGGFRLCISTPDAPR